MIYGTDNRGRLFSKTKGIGEINFEIILGKDGERRNKLMKKEIIESLKLLNKRIKANTETDKDNPIILNFFFKILFFFFLSYLPIEHSPYNSDSNHLMKKIQL